MIETVQGLFGAVDRLKDTVEGKEGQDGRWRSISVLGHG
jgi:hypothetical protein